MSGGASAVSKNSVNYLLDNPFYSHSFEEKREIILLGRPTPCFQMQQEYFTKVRKYKRNFNVSIYAKYQWLCGCPLRKSIFCFPCLHFEGDDSWTKLELRI